MSDLLEIRQSRFGKGLFANRKIKAGTIVCTIPIKKIITFEQTVQLKERESHALQIDQERYVLCEPPFLYSNHSCDPNCGINARYQMFALRDIEEHEELFWDYSTSMLERHWTMDCACGHANCRRVVTDFDLLPAETQSRYLQLKIVFPFIPELMRQRLVKIA